jgi:hypothetical protein
MLGLARVNFGIQFTVLLLFFRYSKDGLGATGAPGRKAFIIQNLLWQDD